MQDLLTSEAANILKVSSDQVRNLHRSGRLPARRTASGVRLFSRADVERLAHERELRRSRLAGVEK